MKEYMQSAREVLAELGVDPDVGLSPSEAEESRKLRGANEFTREKPKSIARRILEAICEPMLIILLVALGITIAVQIVSVCTGGHFDWIECVGIVVAIVISVAISVVMEHRSAKAFEALSRIGEDTLVKVIRGGEVTMIPKRDVVVGDIMCVETGAKLPADGRLIDSVQLMSDESALTGESMAVNKDASCVCAAENTPVAERRNMLYSGCFITGGSGKAVVTGVGDDTEFGKIARELTNQDKSSTPLQEKLAKLGKLITLIGAIAAALIFVIQVIELCVAGFDGMHANEIFGEFSAAFIDSIVLIVAAVPEGLPTIVAVTLAINIIKMSKQNALVKKLVACETVGCINVICSDKTGTLTENRMTVTDVQAGNTRLSPSEIYRQPHGVRHARGRAQVGRGISVGAQRLQARTPLPVLFRDQKHDHRGGRTGRARRIYQGQPRKDNRHVRYGARGQEGGGRRHRGLSGSGRQGDSARPPQAGAQI